MVFLLEVERLYLFPAGFFNGIAHVYRLVLDEYGSRDETFRRGVLSRRSMSEQDDVRALAEAVNKPPAVDAECRLQGRLRIGRLGGDIHSGVLTSTGAGRQQIARDECGRDAFPDLRSESPIRPVRGRMVEACLPCTHEGIHGELSGRRRKGLDGGALADHAWSMGAAIEAEGDCIPAIATFTARRGDTRAELMVGNRRVESTMVGRWSTWASGGQWVIHLDRPARVDPPIHPSALERERGRPYSRCSCQEGPTLRAPRGCADREDEQGESGGRLPIRSRPSLDAVESQERKRSG